MKKSKTEISFENLRFENMTNTIVNFSLAEMPIINLGPYEVSDPIDDPQVYTNKKFIQAMDSFLKSGTLTIWEGKSKVKNKVLDRMKDYQSKTANQGMVLSGGIYMPLGTVSSVTPPSSAEEAERVEHTKNSYANDFRYAPSKDGRAVTSVPRGSSDISIDYPVMNSGNSSAELEMFGSIIQKTKGRITGGTRKSTPVVVKEAGEALTKSVDDLIAEIQSKREAKAQKAKKSEKKVIKKLKAKAPIPEELRELASKPFFSQKSVVVKSEDVKFLKLVIDHLPSLEGIATKRLEELANA